MSVWTKFLNQFARGAAAQFSPSRNGYLKLKGLRQPVDVLTDDFGVPHVFAGDMHDMIFAQGFLHARDRLWQMDLNRRVGEGRLCEVFGSASLAADRFIRKIGLRRLAYAHWDTVTGETRELIEAYSAGVNEGMKGQRPPEFVLLNFKPEAWKPQDTLLWSKVMAFDMGSNWEAELVRAGFVEKLGSDLAARFHQSYLDDCPFTVPSEVPAGAGPALAELRSLYAEAIPWLSLGFGRFPGSNAWAVSGDLSASGKPLMANDPHLVVRLPASWYEMHLECPEMMVYGATLPGSPGVVLGHNRQVAWGVTNSYVDTQDMIIEEFVGPLPAAGGEGRCRRQEGFAPLTSLRETIKIKGKPAHYEEVWLSDNGPLICHSETHGLALRWTGYDFANDTSSQAIFMVNRARSAAEFRQALEKWVSPCLNFVYADTGGNIGYQLAGGVPRRREGMGLYPVPAWESRFEWDGVLDFADLPHLENPPCGFVVSANNAIVDSNYPHFLSVEWMGGFRAQRITQLISEKKNLRAEDFQRFHTDLLCLPGLAITQAVIGIVGDVSWPEPAAKAMALLHEWDGQLKPDSQGGCVYQYLLLHLCREAFLPLLGQQLFEYWMGRPHSPVALMGPYGGRYTGFLLKALKSGSSEFLQEGDSWAEVISRAFRAASAELVAQLGPQSSGWRWGLAHKFQLKHPLGGVPQFAEFFNSEEIEFGGDTDTVCQSAVVPHDPYRTECWAPSWRFVADLSDLSSGVFSVLPSGQSGWPGDRHYLSQFAFWQAGELHPSLVHRGALERSRPDRLTLLTDS